MKLFFILFLFVSEIAFSMSQPRSLSCSKNGTYIIYINGISAKVKDALEASILITRLIENIHDKIDNNSQVDVDYEYNSSEGFFRDFDQLVKEKLAGQKNTPEKK